MTSPKILLVHPMSGDWEQIRNAPFLPLNLIHAAAQVHRELPVQILDVRLDGHWRRTLARAFQDPVLLVGITTMTGTMIASGLEVAAAVRAISPATPLIWGGMHPSLVPDETARHPLVDAVVIADGEDILVDLAHRVLEGRDIAGTPGTVCHRDGATVRAPEAALPNLDALPEPPFDLVDVAAYLPLWFGERCLSFESSRGCPRPCTFCYNTALNAGRFRMMSPEKTVARLAELRARHAFENVYLVDDNFLLDAERGLVIGEGLARLGLSWQIQGADIPSLARIDDATMGALAATGLKRISIGIESGSTRIRKRMKKGASVERVRKEIERLGRFPIMLYASFFVGSPGETIEDVRETIRLVEDLVRLNPRFQPSPFFTYLPLPGTEMLDDAVANGHRTPDTLEGWSHLTFDMESAVSGLTSTGGLTPKQAKALYFASLFANVRRQFTLPRAVLAVMGLYQPVARWRVQNLKLGFLVEEIGFRAVQRAWLAFAAIRRKLQTRIVESALEPA